MSSPTTNSHTGTLVPVAAQFDSWAAYDWTDGFIIDRLSPHDRLVVSTRNSTYELIVTVPHTAEVLVRGGAFFPEFTRAHVAGCSLGGSFLKLHGVFAGFQLEIVSHDQPVVVTTRLRSIALTPAEDGGRVM